LASLSGGETPVKGKRADFSPAGDEDWAARRTFSHGFSLVFLLGLAFAAVAHALGTDHSRAEQTLVAAAFSLSSSSTVLSTLREARLEDNLFGHTIVELLSVQDLVLAPLLALPTAVHELRSSSHSRPGGWMLGVVGGYAGALGVVVLLARRALPRALGHLTRDREADARPDANASLRARRAASDASFGLCVVGYALAMALLGDRLKLSHEAGALFAGLVLVGTPHVDKAKRAVSPLAALFGGMYVASLGLVASPQYVRAHFGAIMGRVTVVVVIKVAVVGPMVYALGFSRAAATGAGFVFAQVSEVALFVAARAHHLQLVTRHTYLDVLSTTIVLLAIAPLFIHVLKRVDRKQFLSLDKDTEHRVTATALLLDLVVAPLKCLRCLVLNLRTLGFVGRFASRAARTS
jgi:CPA2 family monovalent cation:H+ antiporter-2